MQLFSKEVNMLFSQRQGFTPALKEQQVDSIDDELRIRLFGSNDQSAPNPIL
jgi:hypothetical protein